jgi:LuxR family transcriptional regulator, maltose regulon positive regulatory protein
VPNKSARQVAIEAKYLRPRLDHVSLRPDACSAFAAAFDRRLTVVCAPAGYGKTTMTAAALEYCGRPAVWYKLDVLDHDPLAFLAAMTRAVRRLRPGFGAALLRDLESGPMLDIPPQVLAARFCSECDRLVRSRGYVVLDDYHEAMDAKGMNDVLGYLFENCPETVHFVVLTRYEPAFEIERLRLGGEVARIPRDLLLFDSAQVAEVLGQRSGRQHEGNFVTRLLALTEGWPASVVLAGMALEWLDPESLEDALADPRLRMDVFSYLAEQVFQRQTDSVQRFLLRTCCLEAVSVQLAEQLTGSGSASRNLHFLARNQVFTFDAGRKGTYRYHNLLRDYLRQRFVQDEGEQAFRALQLETATALETYGDSPGAIEILLGANELCLALGVVARGGEAELERRPSEQLRIWVSQLSSAVDAGQPWALVVAGVLDTREGRFARALSGLRSAAEALQRDADRGDLYQVLSITEWAEFWSGDSEGSMHTCHRALLCASTSAQRLHTLLSLLSAGVDMRRWDTVRSASARADELLPRARPEEAARAQALRAHAAFYQGNMYAAQRMIQGCHERTQTVAQRAASLNTHAMINVALGDYDSAARHLREATKTAEGFGHSLTSHIEDTVAHLEASIGRFDAARRRLERLHDQSDSVDPTGRCCMLTHQGTVERRSGNLEGGIPSTELAIATVSTDRDPYLAYNARTNLALIQGLMGADRQALMRRLSSDAGAAGVSFVELKALLFAGILAHASEETDEAVALLEECLPRQLALGHVNLIAQELCPKPELVSRVIRRHRSNGLGPGLLEAISHHWRFPESAAMLKELGPTQVATWIAHLGAQRSAKRVGTGGVRRPRTATGSAPRSLDSPVDHLTSREREVLGLMALDRSNDEIAAELFIAVSTVKTHINHILRKLDQTTRVGAILEHQRLGPSPPASLSGNPPWV